MHSPAQPLLTSTALEKSPEGSLLKSTDLDQQLQDFVKAHKGLLEGSDKESVITMPTLSQSSHLSVNNVAMLCAEIEVLSAAALAITSPQQYWFNCICILFITGMVGFIQCSCVIM